MSEHSVYGGIIRVCPHELKRVKRLMPFDSFSILCENASASELKS